MHPAVIPNWFASLKGDGICAALLEALLVEGEALYRQLAGDQGCVPHIRKEVPSCGISREYCDEHGASLEML